MKVQRLTSTGIQDTLTVSDALFGAPVNAVLLAQALRVYEANARQGTAKTKTRSEINRTKHKWFKQKGTGNARHGARTPSIFVGGGVSHGPTGTQNWSLSLPRQMKRLALISALSAQAAQTFVADELAGLKENRPMRSTVQVVQEKNQKVLVVLPEYLESVIRALRNMANLTVVTARRVTIVDIIKADKVIFAANAIEVLEQRIAGVVTEPKVKIKKESVAKTDAKKEAKKAEKAAAPKVAAKKPASKAAAKKPAAKKVAKTK